MGFGLAGTHSLLFMQTRAKDIVRNTCRVSFPLPRAASSPTRLSHVESTHAMAGS